MKISIGAKPLAFPTPAWVIGTYDMFGNPNAATIAWGGISCSDPPCISISLRKATQSYTNIMEKEAFTVNIPSEEYVKHTDYFGMESGENADKFEVAGLTPVKSELVYAPYVEEFPIALECKLIHSFEIGLHTQFIGEIVDIKANESILSESGTPDIEKVKAIVFAPETRNYHGVGKILGKAFSIGGEIKKK
ncbi:flavin reductase family protein [Methanolobus sp. ZRKC2]|uniref:flavin reductase family protein n=1 Tax=Methanolobus sp. ZRKC2 TaxID=3125783 RepID=UPI0032558D33